MRKRKRKVGWELNHGLFEVYWKRGKKGLYADKIRIAGRTFYFLDGYVEGHKKLKGKRGQS